MRIGLLTFHLTTNYGAQLQAFALMTAIRRLGHEVVFINRQDATMRQMLSANVESVGKYRISFKALVTRFVFYVFGIGCQVQKDRVDSAIGFADSFFPQTNFSFDKWNEVPVCAWRLAKIDMVVVGSDQVWNCVWMDPSAYLLENAPQVRALTYAVSFGMSNIPQHEKPRYLAALGRLGAVSAREMEGVNIIVAEGFRADHVCDPTLLIEAEGWANVTGGMETSPRRTWVMYFISSNWSDELDAIDACAKKNNIAVEIFLGKARDRRIRPLKNLLTFVKEKRILKHGNVHVREGAGVADFVRSLAHADGVVSDSFHALMLSSIFHRNVRILEPQNIGRRIMFSRIEEFAAMYVCGDWRAGSIGAACHSLLNRPPITFADDKISQFKDYSLSWLRDALEKSE